MLENWTEIAGLLAALCWAIGGMIYSRLPASAGALNLGKNLLGSIFLGLVIVAFAKERTALLGLSTAAILWLGASGVVGLLIGDASFLRSLQLLGPRRALILSTLVPVFSAILGWTLLAEVLSQEKLIAIAVTMIGVAVVIRERAGTADSSSPGGSPLAGILHGVNASLCQAVGIALARYGMEELEAVSPVASFVRLAIATVLGAGLALFAGKLGPWTRTLTAPGVRWKLVVASLIGTFLGIWLSLIAVGVLPLAVAGTQTSTTPIFMTILVVVIWRERISLFAWLGTLVAFVGVVMLLSS